MNAAETTAQRFFKAYAQATSTIPKSSGNLYELFVYVLVCRAVRKIPLTLQFHSIANGVFRFRTSPGWVNNGWSYCSFLGSKGNHEIRNGVQVQGHSTMHHESDITVFTAFAGNTNGHRDEVVLSVECKEYSSPSGLKGEARKNLGMVQDLSAGSHTSTSGLRQGCIHCGIGFKPLLVTNITGNHRPDIQKFLKAYGLSPRFGVIPRSTAARAFVNDTANRLKVRV